MSIDSNNAELIMSTVWVSGEELKVVDDPEVVRNFQQKHYEKWHTHMERVTLPYDIKKSV